MVIQASGSHGCGDYRVLSTIDLTFHVDVYTGSAESSPNGDLRDGTSKWRFKRDQSDLPTGQQGSVDGES